MPPTPITAYKQIEAAFRTVVTRHLPEVGTKWLEVELTDPKLKFEILKGGVSVIGKEVPNLELNNIKTVSDALKFFLTPSTPDPRKGHPTAEWFEANKGALPQNMQFVPYTKERGVKRELRSKLDRKEY
ncbi:4480_t:CDS:2 [Paraglomus occultum]|uniref:Large ribosomal subunit protein mL50 n=1 Tax=Paraglomus occultum TaxID=144539 RepID=A0A9N9FV07_9GLOM|nr:4480_t:CDS:2 [Paraglomus occultum]